MLKLLAVGFMVLGAAAVVGVVAGWFLYEAGMSQTRLHMSPDDFDQER